VFSRKPGNIASALSANNASAPPFSPAIPALGTSSPPNRNTRSPLAPISSREVARIVSEGQHRNSCSASPAHRSTTCSQLSRTSSTFCEARCRQTAATASSPGDSGAPTAVPTIAGRSLGSTSVSRPTQRTPPVNSGWYRSATASASRVFPHPPVPTIVSSRARGISVASVSSSACRPIRLLSAIGRLPAPSQLTPSSHPKTYPPQALNPAQAAGRQLPGTPL